MPTSTGQLIAELDLYSPNVVWQVPLTFGEFRDGSHRMVITVLPQRNGAASASFLDVDAFLADHGHKRDEIHSWVLHTGGPLYMLAVGVSNPLVWLVVTQLGESGAEFPDCLGDPADHILGEFGIDW